MANGIDKSSSSMTVQAINSGVETAAKASGKAMLPVIGAAVAVAGYEHPVATGIVIVQTSIGITYVVGNEDLSKKMHAVEEKIQKNPRGVSGGKYNKFHSTLSEPSLGESFVNGVTQLMVTAARAVFSKTFVDQHVQPNLDDETKKLLSKRVTEEEKYRLENNLQEKDPKCCNCCNCIIL